jgi:hypothetical protein
MKALRICATGVFSVYALLVLTGCSKSPTEPDNNQYGNTTNGYFTITQPAYGDSVLLGTTIPLGWESSPALIGTNVVIGLYKGDNLVHPYGQYANPGSDTVNLNVLAAYAGSGTDYHFRIASIADPSQYDMSYYFRVYSAYSGTFTVTNPPADTAWTVSTASYVRWTYTGTPGTNATISLYDESSLVYTFTATATIATDSFSVTLPAGLANGNRYRIMVSSSSDRGLYAYGGYFTVVGGTAPDSLEFDGVPDSAKSITTDGVAQSHNLTYGDYDYVKFIADSGTTYTIQTFGTTNTFMYLYERDGVTLIDWDNDSGTGTNALIGWTCTASGVYYFAVRGSGGAMGAYTVSVQ